MTITDPNPTCILTAENMATEDDCTTHDHEAPDYRRVSRELRSTIEAGAL